MSCQKPVRRMALPPGMTAKNHRRHFAQHNYHDHANDVCEESSCEGEHGKTATYKQATTRHRIVGSSSRGGVTTPFPLKLHEMLEGIAKDGLSSIVAWQPHGRSFVVHDPQKFVHEVMPCYFKQTKLSSFQRQLNLYGFSRITTGKDKGAYYHELFLRGHPVLCRKMMRTRIKGTGVRTASSPDTEPNFYLMPPVVQGDIIGKLGNMGPEVRTLFSWIVSFLVVSIKLVMHACVPPLLSSNCVLIISFPLLNMSVSDNSSKSESRSEILSSRQIFFTPDIGDFCSKERS
jgi:hypothetical protein